MNDYLPLMIAVAGIGLIIALPAQRAGTTLAIMLAGLLGLTLLDLGLHRSTSSDIAGFAAAFMVGGFALLAKENR